MTLDTPTLVAVVGLLAFIFGRPVIRLLGSFATVAFFAGYINPSKYQSLFNDLGFPPSVFTFCKDLHNLCAPYSQWFLEQVKNLMT